MVQKQEVKLYGLTLSEYDSILELDPLSPSGLTWKVTTSSTATKGSVAGCYSLSSKAPCWRIKVNKKSAILARVLWFMYYKESPEGVVDHKNGNTKDHSIDNLRLVTQRVNTQNRVVNNPTGVPGVYETQDKYGNLIFRCQGVDFNGKRWSKVFAVRKYGYESALKMAKNFRLEKESLEKVNTRRLTLEEADIGRDEGAT